MSATGLLWADMVDGNVKERREEPRRKVYGTAKINVRDGRAACLARCGQDSPLQIGKLTGEDVPPASQSLAGCLA